MRIGEGGVRHYPFCTLVDKTSGEFGGALVHLSVARHDDEPQGVSVVLGAASYSVVRGRP